MASDRSVARWRSLYRLLLRCYGQPFVAQFGDDMEQAFADVLREHGSPGQRFRVALWMFAETSAGIARENVRSLGKDTHKGLVTLFSVVAFVLAVVVVWSTVLDGTSAFFLGLLLVPMVLGGIVALGLRLLSRRGHSGADLEGQAFDAVSPADVINMAHVRVAGIGGLGFVAMAVFVALALPRVGDTLVIGLIGGSLAAVAVILYRRRRGPIPSSSDQGPQGILLAGHGRPQEPSNAGRLTGKHRAAEQHP